MVSNLFKPKKIGISLIGPPTTPLWPPNPALVEDLKKGMSESGQHAPVPETAGVGP
jgi:hypothetical protein